MRRAEWWPELAGLAEGQAGLFTAAQAQSLGARRPQLVDLVGQGTVERLLHGVYQLSGTPVDRWTAMRAAWLALSPARTAADRLAGDPEGVVSHRSAALLLDLGDVDADRTEITVAGRRRTRNTDVLIHRGHLDRRDWMVHEGLPVTTPIRTVATLAQDGLDGGHLATIARDALLRHDIPTRELAVALGPAAERYGHSSGDALLEDLLRQAGAPASAVDVAAAAAAARFMSTIASNTQIADLARRIGHQLATSPAWEQTLARTAAADRTAEAIRRSTAPMQQQLADVTSGFALPPSTVPSVAETRRAADAALASALTPHVQELLARAAADARTDAG